MLVSDVIDSTYAEWLYPAGIEQPLFDVLDGAIDDSTLTLVLEGRAESVPRTAVLEIGSELVLNKSTAGSSCTLQERGYLNTTAAAHADGTKVLISPKFTRQSVFNALKSVIGLLFPYGLYVRATDDAQTFTSREFLALPTGGLDVLSILVRVNSEDELWRRLSQARGDWVMYPEFTPPKYHLRAGGSQGNTVKVVYKKDFDLASLDSEADDLDTIGVSSTLQPYLPMAAAGHLLRGKDVPRAVAQEIRNLLATQGVQVGAALNIGEALLSAFKREYVLAERRRLSELDEPTFRWVRS
jgi:hypothetical protein